MTDPRQPLTDDEIDDLLTSTLHGPLPNLTMSRVLATVAEVPGLRADIEEASRRVELLGSHECRALSTGGHAPDCPLATLLNGPS